MKREKAEEKEAKKKRSRFDKYGGRIADTVKVIVFFLLVPSFFIYVKKASINKESIIRIIQRLKICTMETLAKNSGFSQEVSSTV